MAKWGFTYKDNGGKHQFFKVTAPDKTAAINKGTERAKKNAKGDCLFWDCKLITA